MDNENDRVHPVFEEALAPYLKAMKCEDCGGPNAHSYGLAGNLCKDCILKLEKELEDDKKWEMWWDAAIDLEAPDDDR